MQSVFLYLPEETFDIWLGLGLSRANVTAYIETISGFCFYGHQIRKSSYAKVDSWELNKNYRSLLAELWICTIKRQPEAGIISFVIKCQLHHI